MPKNTDKKKDAWKGACLYTLLCAVSAGVLLYLRWKHLDSGLLSTLVLLSALLDLGMIVPIWIVFHERMKEIDGREEDAAAEY